jgi:hypothetical protein
MGNAYNSQCKLTEAEINEYTKRTVFLSDEIRALWVHFKTITASNDMMNRKYISLICILLFLLNTFFFSLRQFQAAMLFKDSALLDRIFRVVDIDDDDHISFHEYLSCLSIISNKASQEDKLKC